MAIKGGKKSRKRGLKKTKKNPERVQNSPN